MGPLVLSNLLLCWQEVINSIEDKTLCEIPLLYRLLLKEIFCLVAAFDPLLKNRLNFGY